MYIHERREAATEALPFNTTMPLVESSLWGMAVRYLEGRRLSIVLARRNGWYPSSSAGDCERRLVMPATSLLEGNIYWQARAIDAEHPGPRYQSPSAPRGDALIVVWPNTLLKGAVVAEGPMDALAAAGEGFLGIGLMGTDPPESAVALLLKLTAGLPTLVVSDADQSGALALLLAVLRINRRETRLVLTAPDKDLAEATPARRVLILGGS